MPQPAQLEMTVGEFVEDVDDALYLVGGGAELLLRRDSGEPFALITPVVETDDPPDATELDDYEDDEGDELEELGLAFDSTEGFEPDEE